VRAGITDCGRVLDALAQVTALCGQLGCVQRIVCWFEGC
jgi:hypothetical protein